MFDVIHSTTGAFHVITAIIAMITGLVVILNVKGTRFHKITGYVYVVSMILLNGSAFGIYNFGSFSLFHGFAILSLVTLSAGMYPVIRKSEGWLLQHYKFMSWSVVGLYCAFWAETGVRFFDMRYFWWVVMLATILTSVIGGLIIFRMEKRFLAHRSN